MVIKSPAGEPGRTGANGTPAGPLRILVSGSTRTVGRLAPAWQDRLGHLLTPANGNSIATLLKTGLPWAVDNGAYSGFDPVRFRRVLGRVVDQPGLLWVVCPDRVGDARGTLELFDRWREEVASAGQVAFVGQDGQEDLEVPWDGLSCFFRRRFHALETVTGSR